MLNVMVTGLLCISMLLVASSCNLCLFTVKFYWNIKKKKKKILIDRNPKNPWLGHFLSVHNFMQYFVSLWPFVFYT